MSLTTRSRHARVGPWTKIADEGQRLRIQVALGRQLPAIVQRVKELSEQMRGLTNEPGPEDQRVLSWNIRETVLDVGSSAAMSVEAWQQALDFNAEILLSKNARGADQIDLVRSRFNDVSPLLGLGRRTEARAILTDCRTLYERAGAIPELGSTHGALADIEDELEHHDEALRFALIALRLSYSAEHPDAIATSHHNTGVYLRKADGPWNAILAHRLASALIRTVMRSTKVVHSIWMMAADVRRGGDPAVSALPRDYAGLTAVVEAFEGVRFAELMAKLNVNLDALLYQIIGAATNAAAEPESNAEHPDQHAEPPDKP